MGERLAVKARRRSARSCRHHWVIETPHGATSRGVCKRCGTARRFPNAAQDSLWDSSKRGLGRWSSRRGAAKPVEISLEEEDA